MQAAHDHFHRLLRGIGHVAKADFVAGKILTALGFEQTLFTPSK